MPEGRRRTLGWPIVTKPDLKPKIAGITIPNPKPPGARSGTGSAARQFPAGGSDPRVGMREIKRTNGRRRFRRRWAGDLAGAAPRSLRGGLERGGRALLCPWDLAGGQMAKDTGRQLCFCASNLLFLIIIIIIFTVAL